MTDKKDTNGKPARLDEVLNVKGFADNMAKRDEQVTLQKSFRLSGFADNMAKDKQPDPQPPSRKPEKSPPADEK